jgi:hypothetical protein
MRETPETGGKQSNAVDLGDTLTVGGLAVALVGLLFLTFGSATPAVVFCGAGAATAVAGVAVTIWAVTGRRAKRGRHTNAQHDRDSRDDQGSTVE